jgi:hypothetical protein
MYIYPNIGVWQKYNTYLQNAKEDCQKFGLNIFFVLQGKQNIFRVLVLPSKTNALDHT